MFNLLFYIFAIVTVGSAIVVVAHRRIMYSAYALLFTLVGMSGLFILLTADFIAVVQLVVYAGGILILIVFGLMLTDQQEVTIEKSGTISAIAAAAVTGAIAGFLFYGILEADWKINLHDDFATSLSLIGKELLANYLFIFELLGIVLLIALIGAAGIARARRN